MTSSSKKFARKRGRSQGGRFVMLWETVLASEAYRALTPVARCLHLELRRIAGADDRINGRVGLSVRKAAERLGVAPNTAMRAFEDLQRKGFIYAVEVGHIAEHGERKQTIWRLTELGTPEDPRPSNDFQKWREDAEFPVQRGRTPANKGRRGAGAGAEAKSTASTADTHSLNSCDVSEAPASISDTPCISGCDVSGENWAAAVSETEALLESPWGVRSASRFSPGWPRRRFSSRGSRGEVLEARTFSARIGRA